MANTSTAGYGLRAVMTVGSTPATSGQAEYQILGEGATTGSAVTSKTFFKGDLVSINDGTGTSEIGNYIVQLNKWEGEGKPWKKTGVKGFERKKLGAWDLLFRGLFSAIFHRNQEAFMPIISKVANDMCLECWKCQKSMAGPFFTPSKEEIAKYDKLLEVK